MGVADDGLGVGVAYYTNAFVAEHLVDVAGELGLELGVLDVVDVEVHHIVVDGAQTRTSGAQMGMIIGAVIQLSSTRLGGDDAE